MIFLYEFSPRLNDRVSLSIVNASTDIQVRLFVTPVRAVVFPHVPEHYLRDAAMKHR